MLAKPFQRWGGKIQRRICSLLVCLVILSAISIATNGGGAPPAAHAEARTNDVLFIHGFDDNCGVWDAAKGYMNISGNQWQGNLKTVGYYTGDDGCDVDFNRSSDHQSRCDSYYSGIPGTDGTVNQDLRNISCQLAWYIYFYYTTSFTNVRVVAHSMGGLIIRYALDRVQHHDSAFPPYLYVPVVITMGTPHGGIFDPGGAFAACWTANNSQPTCLQGAEMQHINDPFLPVTGPTAAQFFDTLNVENLPANQPFPPSGGATYTEWTLIGSMCDDAVHPDNATNFPGGPSGIHGTHKIVYEDVPPDNGITYYSRCSSGNLGSYVHPLNSDDAPWDYLHDTTPATSQYQDALSFYCDGCSGQPGGDPTQQRVHHSLAVMYRNLSMDVSAPPAVQNVTNGGNFYTKWVQYGGGLGQFGYPLANWYTKGTGQEQDFVGPTCNGSNSGHIYYSSATGTWEVHGCVATFYLSTAIGGPTGFLGFPTSDETPIALNGTQIGVNNKFLGAPCGSSKYGHIWYNGSAHETHGCIEQAYLRLGGPAGFLGFPSSNEYGIASGRANDFAGGKCGSSGGGHIYKLPTTDAHEVHGCIAQTYLNLGGPGSQYGFPITDEFTNPRTGWRESDFQNGCVVWNSTGGHGYLYSSADGVRYCASA